MRATVRERRGQGEEGHASPSAAPSSGSVRSATGHQNLVPYHENARTSAARGGLGFPTSQEYWTPLKAWAGTGRPLEAAVVYEPKEKGPLEELLSRVRIDLEAARPRMTRVGRRYHGLFTKRPDGTYSFASTTLKSLGWPKSLEELADAIEKATGIRIDAFSVAGYPRGANIPGHTDKEKEHAHDLIASVSIGEWATMTLGKFTPVMQSDNHQGLSKTERKELDEMDRRRLDRAEEEGRSEQQRERDETERAGEDCRGRQLQKCPVVEPDRGEQNKRYASDRHARVGRTTKNFTLSHGLMVVFNRWTQHEVTAPGFSRLKSGGRPPNTDTNIVRWNLTGRGFEALVEMLRPVQTLEKSRRPVWRRRTMTLETKRISMTSWHELQRSSQ